MPETDPLQRAIESSMEAASERTRAATLDFWFGPGNNASAIHAAQAAYLERIAAHGFAYAAAWADRDFPACHAILADMHQELDTFRAALRSKSQNP